MSTDKRPEREDGVWQDLRALLTLERTGPDTFRAPKTLTTHGTLYGGLVAALAVLAAGQTGGPGQLPHSLHAYFLRTATDHPFLDIDVRRVRDGRSFAVREVDVHQGGRTIFSMTTSLHSSEAGDDWHAEVRRSEPGTVVRTRPTQQLMDVGWPFEVRHFATPRSDGFVPLHPFWLRHRRATPDDPLWQIAALTFISDLGVVMDARPPGSALPHDVHGVSLDHTVWFHRPARVDEWLLMETDPLNSGGGRALGHTRISDRSGRLVATVVQEGLHRSSHRLAPASVPEEGVDRS
ncbi:acyl-CoA thioesterase [Streptomyces gilvus]|uniref:acyl-CoA thioesterase n=1 Tax=Streptomyces gilvus TaxID=2920937 RepID=UPI001F0E3329|nr:acyl-CoA thioesterase domain-containing protein [Streptomyces sp. CME 23]MCH5675568.1 thioesterase family protein [Streptomyces sp. CME 23]